MLASMFSFRGRLGRLQYFVRSMGLGFGLVVLVVIGVAAVGGAAATGKVAQAAPTVIVLALLAFPVMGAAMWSSLALQARRFRDIGWNPVMVIPGWFLFDMADMIFASGDALGRAGIPHQSLFGALVNIALGGALLFWPGKPDDGPSPASSIDWDNPLPDEPAPARPQPVWKPSIPTAPANAYRAPGPAPAPSYRTSDPSPGPRTFGRRGL